MSYQALYRVWRPQTFDELVGQDVIAQTLQNAIQNNQISHAYLFSGPRGTGKTSAAKILAKAINCPHAVNGNPCNECETCRGITSGEISDVIEIDAASNNGVDEIRDLRDKVRYAPTQAKNKVYIIDEVHMLTTGAFNALLKTLEEPPEHVVFILATTEAHKIPATILSRTQRFDFQRISDQDIIGRMKHILDHDQIEYDLDGLAVIARAANGAMRDSLSLLDQALSYNNQRVSVETALQVTGSLAQSYYKDYLIALSQHDTGLALDIVKKTLKEGKQAHRFIEDLILFARDVLLSTYLQKNHSLLLDDELKELVDQVEADFYYPLIDRLNQTQGQMRFSNQPEVYLEVATVQLSQGIQAQALVEPSSASSEPANVGVLFAKLSQFEQEIQSLHKTMQAQDQLIRQLQVSGTSTSVASKPIEEKSEKLTPRSRPNFIQQEYQLDLHNIYKVLNQATRQGKAGVSQAWPQVLQSLSPQDRAKLRGGEVLAAGSNEALIGFGTLSQCSQLSQETHLQGILNNELSRLMGETYHLALISQEDWPSVRENYRVLFEKNGRQPIELPEPLKKVEAQLEPVETHEVSVQVIAQSNPQTSSKDEANKDSDKPEIISWRQDASQSSSGHDSDLDSLQANDQDSGTEKDSQTEIISSWARAAEAALEEEEVQEKQEPVEGQLGFFDLDGGDSMADDIQQGPSEFAQKAIDLFGEDKVNIIR